MAVSQGTIAYTPHTGYNHLPGRSRYTPGDRYRTPPCWYTLYLGEGLYGKKIHTPPGTSQLLEYNIPYYSPQPPPQGGHPKGEYSRN